MRSAAIGSCEMADDSGTSMAAPAVAGAAALVRQYFREGWYPTGAAVAEDALEPSGALVRAVLINGGRDMTGVAGYPSNQEGWGRLVLEEPLYFAGDTRRLVVVADVANAVGLSTGATDLFELTADGKGEPLELTLVYTDPPATLLSMDATVNDLDLVLVAPDGTTYLGNVFDTFSGHSVPGGSADPRNTVEAILIPAPGPGTWRVEVHANEVNDGPQGYALIATGAVSSLDGNTLRYVDHQVDDGGMLANGDGVVDPGETLTLPVELLNLGRESASAVTATLSADEPQHVQVSRPEAGYPDIAGSDSDVSLAPHFELTVSPSVECGTLLGFEVTASHDGGTRTSPFVLQVGDTRSSYAATDTPLELPEFAGSATESTLTVGTGFAIGDVTVEVHVTHPDIGELAIDLISPSGTTVRLHDRTDSGTINLLAIYDETRAPDGPGSMSWFDGEPAAGVWTLSLVDDVIGGFPPTPAGTLQSWTLRFDAANLASCDPLDCAGDALPGPVGPSLRLNVEGADLRYSWDGVRGAAGYRVWRSTSPEFVREELVGLTDATSFVEPGGGATGPSWYYRVRAVNSCNWSGP
ncbi:MAG: S8 family serine peptidase [Actinobacteria bacterium]|nr:S8 family serine peptidase [Actinomycetota bacterium]